MCSTDEMEHQNESQLDGLLSLGVVVVTPILLVMTLLLVVGTLNTATG